MTNEKTCTLLGPALSLGKRIVLEKRGVLWAAGHQKTFGDVAKEMAAAKFVNGTYMPMATSKFVNGTYTPLKIDYYTVRVMTGFLCLSGRIFLAGGAVDKSSTTVSVPLDSAIEVGSLVWEGLQDVPLKNIHPVSTWMYSDSEHHEWAYNIELNTNVHEDLPEYKSLGALKAFSGMSYEHLTDLGASWPEFRRTSVKEGNVSVLSAPFVSRFFAHTVGDKALSGIGEVGLVLVDLVKDELSEGLALKGVAWVNEKPANFYIPADGRVNAGTLCVVMGRLPTRRDVLNTLRRASIGRENGR